MDALQLLALLPDASVDAIITDLPYGTTACTWDAIIPFAPMWAGVKRVLKPRGLFVTTSSQPFTSQLVMSNLAWFRDEWIWEKSNATRFLDANTRPMKNHENVLVFSPVLPDYYPQMGSGAAYKARRDGRVNYVFDSKLTRVNTDNDGTRYPKTVLKISSQQRGKQHPTEKPVELYEYLIKTYTAPGALVVDFCCGSGTTGVAARKIGRDYILGDITPEYVDIARARLTDAPIDVEVAPGIVQVSMFNKEPEDEVLNHQNA